MDSFDLVADLLRGVDLCRRRPCINVYVDISRLDPESNL